MCSSGSPTCFGLSGGTGSTCLAAVIITRPSTALDFFKDKCVRVAVSHIHYTAHVSKIEGTHLLHVK